MQGYPRLVLRDSLHVWEGKERPACAPAGKDCTAIASQPAHTAALLWLSPVSVVAILAAECTLESASQLAAGALRELFCCATWRQDLLVSYVKLSQGLPSPPEHTPTPSVLSCSIHLLQATRLAKHSFQQAVSNELAP